MFCFKLDCYLKIPLSAFSYFLYFSCAKPDFTGGKIFIYPLPPLLPILVSSWELDALQVRKPSPALPGPRYATEDRDLRGRVLPSSLPIITICWWQEPTSGRADRAAGRGCAASPVMNIQGQRLCQPCVPAGVNPLRGCLSLKCKEGTAFPYGVKPNIGSYFAVMPML